MASSLQLMHQCFIVEVHEGGTAMQKQEQQTRMPHKTITVPDHAGAQPYPRSSTAMSTETYGPTHHLPEVYAAKLILGKLC